MLLDVQALRGYHIQAIDEQIGKVDEFYIDEKSWQVCYLVVDVGNWLTHERVLLSPTAITFIDTENKVVGVGFTSEKVENSPGIDTAKPVSRELEEVLHRHYDWQPYWQREPLGTRTLADPTLPSSVMIEAASSQHQPTALPQETKTAVTSKLRSTNEVTNYYIHASNGDIGHVEDFIVDTKRWYIRYLVIDTRNWLPGNKVLIPPAWVTTIHWANSTVAINVTKEQVESSPPYDSNTFVQRGYEEQLYKHYNQKPYWP